MSIFERLSTAGFRADLLPIIPVGATLSEHTTVAEASVGKVPGLPYGSGGWGGFPGWQTHIASPDDIATWSRYEKDHGAGAGLQSRNWPAVDIDVLDEGISARIAAAADMILGPAPVRTGRPPKRLLPYALAVGSDPARKTRVVFTLPGDERQHVVEILGDGQQYIVSGTHAGTGQPYTWEGGDLAAVGAGGLTPVTSEALSGFADVVAALIEEAGGTLQSRSRGAAGGTGEGASASALSSDSPEAVADALRHLGNDLDYDEWVKLGRAVKAALNEDETHYSIFEEWCLAYPGNTPEIARAKWDSFMGPHRVGAAYVFETARRAGWSGYGAVASFTAVPLPDPSQDPGVPVYLREWVYAVQQERFVRLSDRLPVKEAQFARIMSSSGIGPENKNNPAKLFFQHPARRMPIGLTYIPGEGPLPNVRGEQRVNLWSPPSVDAGAKARAATVTDADAQPWLDHMAYLVPDARERNIMLDWMAYIVQHPRDKPNWAVFLGGGQGIGKDMMLLPMIRAVGESNTRTVQPSELQSDYTDWMANKRFIVVEEMRNFETKSVMNKLKMYITRPPENVPVHLKYMPIYETPNVGCYFFMSNFRDALSLEQDDRRYFVYWSPAKPRPAPYYDALGRFLEGVGGDDVVAWLHARDVTAFAAQGTAPATAHKTAMIGAAQSDFEAEIADLMESGVAPFDAQCGGLRQYWEALPDNIRRLRGASMRKLGTVMEAHGGGPVGGENQRRVRVDGPGGSRSGFGFVRLWATHDADRLASLSQTELADAFRFYWDAAFTGTSPFPSLVKDAAE